MADSVFNLAGAMRRSGQAPDRGLPALARGQLHEIHARAADAAAALAFALCAGDRAGLALLVRARRGGWRTVPWDVVVRVDFPPKLRFARIVLPGDEAFAIYAVQRTDKEQAIAVMDALRDLHARVRADTA